MMRWYEDRTRRKRRRHDCAVNVAATPWSVSGRGWGGSVRCWSVLQPVSSAQFALVVRSRSSLVAYPIRATLSSYLVFEFTSKVTIIVIRFSKQKTPSSFFKFYPSTSNFFHSSPYVLSVFSVKCPSPCPRPCRTSYAITGVFGSRATTTTTNTTNPSSQRVSIGLPKPSD